MTFRLLPLASVISLAGCTPPQRPAPPEKIGPTGPVRIMQFYANAAVRAGDPVTICYGVEHARAVRIEPPVEPLKPVYVRCVQASPQATTTYKLTAEGLDGTTATRSATVRVLPATAPAPPPPATPALIRTFAASSEVVAPGSQVVLCYAAPEAGSVAIEPSVRDLHPADSFCFSTRVDQTTTYTLTATAAGGRDESERITVTVK